MAVENGPVEDVFPIEHGDFPASHVSLLEGNYPLFVAPTSRTPEAIEAIHPGVASQPSAAAFLMHWDIRPTFATIDL